MWFMWEVLFGSGGVDVEEVLSRRTIQVVRSLVFAACCGDDQVMVLFVAHLGVLRFRALRDRHLHSEGIPPIIGPSPALRDV